MGLELGACQPEKRKVGSSTLPLTTRSDQAILPVYLRQRYFGPHLLAARRCPSKTSHDRLWRFTAARGLHGPEVAVWMQTIGARQPCGLPWTPETTAAPGARKSGRPRPAPALRAARKTPQWRTCASTRTRREQMN
jgi:hypothetical protein